MGDLEPYEHQVAGWHNGSLSCVLKNKKGQILKPVKLNANPTYDSTATFQGKEDLEKDKNKEELLPVCRDERAFYELVRSSTKADDLALKALIPEYHGCQEVEKADGKVTPHLILEDLAAGLSLPCVVDIKVGLSQDYPKNAKSNTKIKYATQNSLGFCLTGVRVYHPIQSELILDLRPDACKRLTTDEVFNALEIFSQEKSPSTKELCTAVVEGLLKVREWVVKQRSYVIRRGSVLILYDANSLMNVPQSAPVVPSNGNGADNLKENAKGCSVKVKMIDFAHVFHAQGERDDNYLIGLDNLIKFFNEKG